MPFKQPGENLKCPFFFFCKGIMIATVVHEHPWHDFALSMEIARAQAGPARGRAGRKSSTFNPSS
jgi:hypothetical protein